jgi:hypothetical protein
MAASDVKRQFKVPEGRYVLHTAKEMGLVPFAMRRTTRLTIATLHGGVEEGMYMIYNVGDYLHVSPFDATEKVTQRTSAYAAFGCATAFVLSCFGMLWVLTPPCTA